MVITQEQRWLLQASCLPGPDGLAAWREWQSRTAVETLDAASQWLLPLLYDTLTRQSVAGVELARYRAVYQHHWYRTHLTFRRAEPTLEALARITGRAPLLIGGSAAAVRHDRCGVRPIERIEALVPSRSGAVVEADAATTVALRTRLYTDALDEEIQARATHARWRGRTVRVMDPADQMTDLCLRSHVWDRRSPLLWIADAAWLLRAHPDLDWSRVTRLAHAAGCAPEMAAALGHLHAALPELVPPVAGVGAQDALERSA